MLQAWPPVEGVGPVGVLRAAVEACVFEVPQRQEQRCQRGEEAEAVLMYCSLSGRGPNLNAILAAGWGILIAPSAFKKNVLPPAGTRICVDNGAWTAFQSGQEWDAQGFVRMAHAICGDAEFVIAPDVVGQREASLARTREWLPWCAKQCRRVLVAAQDGMEARDVAPFLSERVGIFVGGSTEWKLDTLAMWAGLARSKGAYCHVGRVNTIRRINRCSATGVDSCDGTSAIKFPSTLKKLNRAMNAPSLLLGV